MAAAHEADPDRADPLLEESLRLARVLGDGQLIYRALRVMGISAHVRRDYDQARTLFEESLALCQEQGDMRRVALLLLQLGRLHLQQGALTAARHRLQESLPASEKAGVKVGFAPAFLLLAFVAAADSQPVRALRLAGAAERARKALGDAEEGYAAYVTESERWLRPARQALREQAPVAWSEGEAMTLEEATAYALADGEGDSRQRSAFASGLDPLTPRERAVAELVARRLTNRQIAAELFISEATAKRHVENILGKLGLASRAQVPAWVAAQRSLVEQSK